MASSLSDSARQNELAAWELCARESMIRERNVNRSGNMPWVIQEAKKEGLVTTQSSPISHPGKRPRGRPRKVALVELAAGPVTEGKDNAGTDNQRETNGGSQEGHAETGGEASGDTEPWHSP